MIEWLSSETIHAFYSPETAAIPLLTPDAETWKVNYKQLMYSRI